MTASAIHGRIGRKPAKLAERGLKTGGRVVDDRVKPTDLILTSIAA